ncbi:MAG: hypothetical protein ACLRIP_10795 [Blautia massiliensis (ex Durand et al. 2017)]
MKVKKWKLASFLLPCLLLFALIYLAPMRMVFGSSFFEWKAGGVFKFIGLIIISMLSERRTNAYSTEEYGNLAEAFSLLCMLSEL